MTKELIMEIVLTRDYLWDIIDNFIYLNGDKSSEYYNAIHAIYNDTLKTYKEANVSKFNLNYLEIITIGLTVIRLIDLMNSYNNLTKILNESQKFTDNTEKSIKLGQVDSQEIYKTFLLFKKKLRKWHNRYTFANIYGNFANIHLLLFAFKGKIYVTKEFINTFAENIAQYIQEQIVLGNCSQEFIAYLNTYLN